MVGRMLIVLVVLLGAAPAADASPWMGAAYDESGDPVIPVSAHDWEVVNFRRCPPGGAPCEPLGSGWIVEPGETPAGTVFEAESQEGIDRLPPWQGRVTSVVPPTLAGS